MLLFCYVNIGLTRIKAELEKRVEVQGMLTQLQEKFSHLIDLVVQHISANQLRRLVTLIISKLTSSSLDFGCAIQQLRNMHTVNDVFEFLMESHFCGYLNYNMLRVISPLYDDECREELAQYEKAYMAFAKVANLNLLFEMFFEQPEFGPQIPVGLPQISFTLDESQTSRSLQYVHTVQSQVFSAASGLMLASVQHNSNTLAFSILPSDHVSVERDLADNKNAAFLKEISSK